MEYRVAARTDVGRRRPHNEDSMVADLPLVAVADGMGGHSAGEVASKLALEVLQGWKDRMTTDASATLVDAVQEANRRVWSKGRDEASLEGMGTTLTAAWVHEDGVTLAHVGDSRAYLLRGEALSQLTEDQTVVYQMEKEGKITAEEAAVHPSRHMLLQAIGSEPAIKVDMTSFELQPGDRLLLASDGLHGLVSDEQIQDVLSSVSDPDEACGNLIDLANEAGGDDNITVVIVEAIGDGAAGEGTAAGPVIVSKPSPAKDRGSRLPSRRVVGIAAVVLLTLLLIVWGAIQLAPGDRYLVGTYRGNVAILRGQPGTEDDPPEAELVRRYPIPLSDVARPFQPRLRAGIVVSSIAEAERRVESIPRVLGPQDTPSPSPTAPPPPSPPPPAATQPPPSAIQ